ncbi:hypothetical protein G7046_g1293 [Stylonectria norvegica]|nr:hypothetical protein G7046_g1293 [Stylonectria norvegica]
MHLHSIIVTAAVAALATAIPVDDDLERRTTDISDTNLFPMPLCNGIDIEDATIGDLQRWMILERLSSQDLVNCYLARIEQTNGTLHSVSEVNPDALHIAAALDDERSKKGLRGPLHGIPFMVKDNHYTDDKHNTSEGGLVLLGGRYSQEATVVSKIRAAGGILLGHAALSEAADHRAISNFSDGYSTRVGQTRNPFNLTQLTSGSSGGSAVVVRINQAAFSLGSETHGSLMHPSAHSGLRSIKSTPGLISRHGIVTNKDSLRGMKLGLPWNSWWSTNAAVNTPGQRELYESKGKQLKAAGAEIYNITYIPNVKEIANPYGFGQPADTPPEYNQLIAYNTLLAVGYGEWLQNWTFPESDERHRMSSLAEMAIWNDAHNSSTGSLGNGTYWRNHISGQDFYDHAVLTNGTLGDVFWKAFGWGRRTAREAIDGGYAHTLENGTTIELDALIVPNDNGGGGDSACASIPSYAGYPVASVPVGQNGYDVPCGMCIYGREWGEAELIRVASAMDDLFQWTATPKWHNYKTAQGPWDPKWPGYPCTHESLDRNKSIFKGQSVFNS